MRDLKNRLAAASSLVPAVRTATANGTGVDLQGYESAVVVFNVGAWTDGTHTISVQESDVSGSGYAAVAAGDLLGTLTAISGTGQQNAVQMVGYRGSKRYIRAIVTVTGSPSTGAAVGGVVVRGRPRSIGTAA
jgi:hypothetical protein